MLSGNHERASRKEFVHAPIDLTPLLEAANHAAKTDDWTTFDKLIEQGYSLHWLDHITQKSVLRMLAEQGRTTAVLTLLDKEMIKLGNNHPQLDFLMGEAIHGAVTAGQADLHSAVTFKIIQEYHDKVAFCNAHRAYAELEQGIANDFQENKEAAIDHGDDTILFQLARGGHTEQVIQILNAGIKQLCKDDAGISPNAFIKKIIAAALTGAALCPQIDLATFLKSVKEVTARNKEPRDKFVKYCDRKAIAIAAAYGHTALALQILDNCRIQLVKKLDVIIGEAIISAAQQGRADSVIALSVYAKKHGITSEHYTVLLGRASGGALANEHFSLAKVLMQMSPKFDAEYDDWNTVNSWTEEQVSRMFRIIRDYKIFTDIALHSGLASKVNSPAWISALKKEYGLEELSNDGFNTLIHNPEIIEFLLQYRPENASTALFPKEMLVKIAAMFPEVKLEEDDIRKFIDTMNRARNAISPRNSRNIAFFRVKHFLTPPNPYRSSAEDMQCCIQIQNQITELVNRRCLEKQYRYTAPIERLLEFINNAVSVRVVLGILQECREMCIERSELREDGHTELVNLCLEILDKPEFKNENAVARAWEAEQKLDMERAGRQKQPKGIQCWLNIRTRINQLLNTYLSEAHLHKGSVKQLQFAINGEIGVESILAQLQRAHEQCNHELLKGAHMNLLNRCLAVFDEPQFSNDIAVKMAKTMLTGRPNTKMSIKGNK